MTNMKYVCCLIFILNFFFRTFQIDSRHCQKGHLLIATVRFRQLHLQIWNSKGRNPRLRNKGRSRPLRNDLLDSKDQVKVTCRVFTKVYFSKSILYIEIKKFATGSVIYHLIESKLYSRHLWHCAKNLDSVISFGRLDSEDASICFFGTDIIYFLDGSWKPSWKKTSRIWRKNRSMMKMAWTHLVLKYFSRKIC